MMLKIFCWNNDNTVWNHWLSVIDTNKYDLIRIEKMEDLLDQLSRSEQDCLCFIFLEDELFTEKVEAAVSIRLRFNRIKIVAFPNQQSQSAALRLLSAGINGQCNPFIGAEQLKLVLSVVLAGEIWGGKAFIQQLISQSAGRIDTLLVEENEKLSLLTPKEKIVAEWVAKGLSNKVIAVKMSITERTVKAHLTNIFKKTASKDRLSLAMLVQSVPQKGAEMEDLELH